MLSITGPLDPLTPHPSPHLDVSSPGLPSTSTPSTSTPSCRPWGHSLPRPGEGVWAMAEPSPESCRAPAMADAGAVAGRCDCPTCAVEGTTQPSWPSSSTSRRRPPRWRKGLRGHARAEGLVSPRPPSQTPHPHRRWLRQPRLCQQNPPALVYGVWTWRCWPWSWRTSGWKTSSWH